MIYSHTKPRSSGTTGSIDIVTYRYSDDLVYVPLAREYNQALSHARDAFRELKGLPDASISLSLASPGHPEKLVGISAPAWPRLIAHLTRYQIIDVHATRVGTTVVPIPDITITYADAEEQSDAEPAPPYPSHGEDEKKSYPDERSPPPATPATTLHRKRSWFFQQRHGH
ncbi:hypothetical protein V8E55_008825 [Tylopilus felleus]|jgi:hypothetical protein